MSQGNWICPNWAQRELVQHAVRMHASFCHKAPGGVGYMVSAMVMMSISSELADVVHGDRRGVDQSDCLGRIAKSCGTEAPRHIAVRIRLSCIRSDQ